MSDARVKKTGLSIFQELRKLYEDRDQLAKAYSTLQSGGRHLAAGIVKRQLEEVKRQITQIEEAAWLGR